MIDIPKFIDNNKLVFTWKISKLILNVQFNLDITLEWIAS